MIRGYIDRDRIEPDSCNGDTENDERPSFYSCLARITEAMTPKTEAMIPPASPIIGEEERHAVELVMKSGTLAQGPEVASFEIEFEDAVDGRECVAVNSGTSALLLALIALGIRAGDDVIVPSFTFAATANAVRLAGGNPVFVDIEPSTFCIDPDRIQDALTERTRAIIPVHLYGHPADMTRIGAVAAKHGLIVVEDAAQAHLAQWHGKRVGSFGDAGCFSFYPTKNMTAGEGGMVSVARSSIAHQVRLLRNQGMERRYQNEVVGFNNRMSDIHAAIGRVQLRRLHMWTLRRQEIAALFDAELVNVVKPKVSELATHVYHQYTIRIPDGRRDEFATELADRGVGSGIYYPIPVHLLPSFGEELDLPQTMQAASEVLSLPVHPSLSERDIERIVNAVNDVACAGS